MGKATVFFQPEEKGRLVTLHACWVADNGHETAVFPTQSAAVEFARRRWRQEPVVGPDGGRS